MIKSENLEGFQKLLAEYYTECAMYKAYPVVSSVNKSWEVLGHLGDWEIPETQSVMSHVYLGIRRKKKTVNINGFDVVPPIVDRFPDIGQEYFYFDTEIDGLGGVSDTYFNTIGLDKEALKYGWHEIKEEAQEYWKARFSDIVTNYGDE